MNILILSFYYQPDLCAGSFRCTALVKQLQKTAGTNLNIDLITTAPNRYASFDAKAALCEETPGLKIQRLELPRHQSGMLDQAKAFMHYAHQVKRLIKGKKYSIVFATSSRLMTAALGSWAAQKTQAKLYLDIRDIFVDTIADVLPPSLSYLSKPFFSGLEKWALKKADKINLVSQGFKPYFFQRYPGKTFSWFSNGIDSDFLQVKAALEQSPREIQYPIKVLYAGNIGEGQGLHHIIPALAQKMQDKISFKIIGDGGRKTQLEDKLKALNCQNVELLAPIDRQALIKEYQEAQVLFLHLNDYPAFRKVLPSKLFEYAALDKPIWAGVSGHAANFIAKEISNAAIFYPCDREAAEKSFKTLNLEPMRRESFIEKFSSEKILQEMAEDILALA